MSLSSTLSGNQCLQKMDEAEEDRRWWEISQKKKARRKVQGQRSFSFFWIFDLNLVSPTLLTTEVRGY